jgi:hypothetical protein
VELSPLSTILAEDMSSLLSVFPTFATMTDAEKADFLSAVQQDICRDFNNAGLPDYEVNNYTDPLTPGTGVSYAVRSGTGLANPNGVVITFQLNGIDTPFNVVPNLFIAIPGVTSVNPATNVDTLDASGFIAFALEETEFKFFAVEPT